MPLGLEVGLSPGNVVVDGDPAAPPQKGRGAPNFRRMSIVVKRLHIWIKMSLGTEVGLSLRDIVRRGPSSPPLKCTAPNFRPMSVVAKRLDSDSLK